MPIPFIKAWTRLSSLLALSLIAVSIQTAQAVTLRSGEASVEVTADGRILNLTFAGDEVICPEIILWRAIWDGGQNNEAPDRKNGPSLRCADEGVDVAVTAVEGADTAFLDFDHPDVRVLMRIELAERHLDLIPYRVLNRREERLVGLEYPSAAYHPITDHSQYIGVAWGGLALQAQSLRQGASFKTECPQATHDLALMLDRPLSLATFSVQPLTQVPFRRTTFGPVGERAAEKGWSGLSHELSMWAASGQTEALPPVRLAVGADAVELFDAYRAANGMNEWPTLADKWGRKAKQLASCLHLKHDLNHFESLGEGRDELDFIRELPGGPYLWEMVCYHGRFGIHDVDYPDFTIFAETHGGERMFKLRATTMKHRGDLVSVYANPFWWQEDSEGVQALGGIEEIAVRKRDGSLDEQFYSHNKHGYIIGAWRQPVIEQEVARLTSLRDRQGLDMVFQDTYGTRGEYDFAEDFHWPPYGYAQALIDMARHSSAVLPVAGEGVGLDRTFRYLGATMGFYLTTMNASRSRFYDNQHRSGTTRQWPIGALILRDKVAFYPHNLAVSILTSENLSWAVAAGMNMHYQTRRVLMDLQDGTGYDRLTALSYVQKTFCAPVFGARVTAFGFVDHPFELTRTAYANGFEVYASHDDAPRTVSVNARSVELAPHGFILFQGANPVSALLASNEHAGGVFHDWDRKAKDWIPVMPWKPTALTGMQ